MIISCCLIGEDSLTIQCGNILIARHHHIKCVISSVRAIQEWAKKSNIDCFSCISDLVQCKSDVDYIFSIVNSYILSNEILMLSRKGVINYHDSLLPKYAGLNSTTWAILNNEKEHGVTWHFVNDRLDEGDIVKQRTFPIYEDDTAFTLNLRCYEQAILSFTDMIIDIEQDNLLVVKQNLQDRSYFGLNHALPNFGFIDWQHHTAEFIVRTNRSVTLGHYSNNIGLLKIYFENSCLFIGHVEVSPFKFKAESPGVVLAIRYNSIYISTIDHAIKIDDFISKSGFPLSVDEVVTQYGIMVGHQFLLIQESIFQRFNTYYPQALKNEEYWINQLRKIDDHSTFSSKAIQRNIEINQFNSIIDLSNCFSGQYLTTEKNSILTAILIYLYRLNNYEKVSVSIPYRNRTQTMLQCGHFFSCFLPLIADWQADITLKEVVIDVDRRMKEIENHNVFFTDISARHPEMKGNTLESGILVNLSTEPISTLLLDNTVLYFQLDEKNNKIHVYHRLDLIYQHGELKDILSNLAEHVTTILSMIIINPYVLVNEFCFLTPMERHKLLTEWGTGANKPLPCESITVLFEKQVACQPNSPAIIFGEKIISYSQLWDLSEKIASFIHLLHLPSQSLIGIYINRSIEMLAIILGILKADCVYVPLDTKYPLSKIETIINNANLLHIITSNMSFDKLDGYFKNKDIVSLYSVETILIKQELSKFHPTDTKSSLNKLAYIMFTSGTTGAPKGVVVTQKNVINYCQWFSETSRFTASSLIDFSSSIAFDLSVPCTIAPLLVGGKIAICADADKTNPERYLQHLRSHKITHTELTPGYLEMLLNYPDTVKQLLDLKVLLLGADVVPTADVMKWLELCPHHQVINEYGPTEATVSATSYFVNKEIMINEVSVPIGRPAFNTSCYLLDKYSNLCPSGVKGELHIAGAQVATGYLGKPKLTHQKFITAAFNNHQNIMYKTGDLARWLPDGNLQFFGRNDFQVKMQGYRIELTGIEAILTKISEINQAVVVVQNGHFKEKYLRAYLVSDNHNILASDIKTYLEKHLPHYMIPKEFCITSAIPLKENEKIDFAALEKEPYRLLTFDYDVAEELTEHEKISMRIWQQAFNNNSITNHDDFFDIGGDSLLALHLITELKKYYQIDIPLYYLFEYPTIALLSKKISELINQKDGIKLDMTGKGKRSMSIIKLSTGSYHTPLFLVHPVGGSIFWYKKLAKYLEGKYTIYGIQDINIDGLKIQFSTLQEMAGYYLQEIAFVYSGDNYCLGGASFGATVAFEMAHQLLNMNKKIEFLGFFDGWAVYPDELMKEDTLKFLSKDEEDDQIFGNEKPDYLKKLEEYRKTLLLNYKLPVLHTNASLFKAIELWPSFLMKDDPSNGWRPFIDGNITQIKVLGNHETMFFEPNVSVLAETLSDTIFSSSDEVNTTGD